MKKQDKHSVIRAFSKEYKQGRKREKTLLLNKLTKITGYSRKHLQAILPHPPTKRCFKRNKVSPYLSILKLLQKLWAVSNYACGERLVPMISIYLSALKRLWTYLNYPAYLIGQGNPLVVGWYWTFLILIFLFGSFYLTKSLFGKPVAYLFVVFESGYLAFQARAMSNPHGALFVIPFFYYFLSAFGKPINYVTYLSTCFLARP